METKKEVETRIVLRVQRCHYSDFLYACACEYLEEMEHLQEEDEDWCSFNEYFQSFEYYR
jgi:hypothetical protein